jgi:DNA-binding GntR family transcriptional regulator
MSQPVAEWTEAENGQLSLSETAFSRIKRAIIHCDLAPGEQVSEAQLSKRFDVGRSAVRAALNRLIQERLVEAFPYRGYVIAPITLKSVHDLSEVRATLEEKAARLAAGRLSPEQQERLGRLSEVTYAVDDPVSIDTIIRANRDLHVLIAESSGNVRLTELITSLLDEQERVMYLVHSMSDKNEVSLKEHRELAQAIIAGEADHAAEVINRDILRTRQSLIDALMASRDMQAMNLAGIRTSS